jgi:hypothetical protein
MACKFKGALRMSLLSFVRYGSLSELKMIKCEGTTVCRPVTMAMMVQNRIGDEWYNDDTDVAGSRTGKCGWNRAEKLMNN